MSGPDSLTGTSVAEFGLGIQAWWGREAFDPAQVDRGGWPEVSVYKPKNRFFTSSWDRERQTSAWVEYQATTARISEPRRVWLLKPDPNAALYIINTPDDFTALAETYPDSRRRRPEPCPYWEHIAQEGGFDAIHMTAAAVVDHNLWYANAWTVESTLWFRSTLAPVNLS
jgi:hypothetical protein